MLKGQDQVDRGDRTEKESSPSGEGTGVVRTVDHATTDDQTCCDRQDDHEAEAGQDDDQTETW